MTPVQCVNSLDFDYPEYVEYSADRILGTGVSFETDQGFLTCCDCENDCEVSVTDSANFFIKSKANSNWPGNVYRTLQNVHVNN